MPDIKPEPITLRDYFATHADTCAVKFMTVENAAVFLDEPFPTDWEGKVRICALAAARLRYIYADAMLQERTRKHSA
jgi:hypothetical protein